MLERASKNGWPTSQWLCNQGELQLLSVSLDDSARSEGWSDPGSCQITDSALGPRACEILCVPFKSEVFISPTLWDSQKPCLLAFKAKCSELVFSLHYILVVFSLLMISFLMQKLLSLIRSCLFIFTILLLWETDLRNCCDLWLKNVLPMFFFQEFYWCHVLY